MSRPPSDHTVDDLIDPDHRDEGEDEEPDATAVAAPAARRRTDLADSGAGQPASVHERPTAPLPPAVNRAGTTGTEDHSTRHTTAATPLEALHLEEVARTRFFCKVVVGIVAMVAATLPFLHGDPLLEKILYASLVLAAAPTLWLYVTIREPHRYTVNRVSAVGYCLAVSAYVGVAYWGIFSPAPALVLMGIYFFSLGASFAASVLIYLSCAAAQATLTALVVTGVIRDPGLITAGALTASDQIITQAIVQFLFLCAFLIARSSRQSQLDAIGALEQAVRAVSQREALLLEARQDLDRALRIGGPGRYTEQQVGSFRLGVLIGRGGMGEVYHAVHVETAEPAAVKLLHAQALANPDHLQRFVRETQAATALRSEHVVRVLEVGGTDGELPYMAMELLTGHDLAHHLRRRRRLTVGKVVTLARHLARGLDEARRLGIVHRDLKPQNVFLAERGDAGACWKILDFGVSKLADHGGTLTRGHVVGTPGYMAPEQARGEEVDHRADVYALAAIVYRALTGHPPFSGKDVPTTLYDVVYRMPAQPSDLAEEVPEDVDAVLAVGLAKRRDERFETAVELCDALAAAADGAGDAAVRRRAHRILEDHPWGVSK